MSVFFSFVHLYSYDSDPVFLLPALFKGCAKSFGSVIPVHLFLSSSVMLSIFVILQKPPHAIYHRLFLSTCRFFPFLIFHLLPYFIDHASFDRSFVVSSTEAFTLPTFVRFYLSPSPNAPPCVQKNKLSLWHIFDTAPLQNYGVSTHFPVSAWIALSEKNTLWTCALPACFVTFESISGITHVLHLLTLKQ